MGLEWSLRKLVDIATNGDVLAFDLYYNEKPLSETWALLANLRSNLFNDG